MQQQIDAYTVKCSGDGYEIVSPHGTVIAWAVENCWATIIAALLNRTEAEGLTASLCGQPTPPH